MFFQLQLLEGFSFKFDEKNSVVVREAVAAAVEQMTVTMEGLVKKIMRPSMKIDAMAAERIAVWNAQVRSILKNYYFFFQKKSFILFFQVFFNTFRPAGQQSSFPVVPSPANLDDEFNLAMDVVKAVEDAKTVEQTTEKVVAKTAEEVVYDLPAPYDGQDLHPRNFEVMIWQTCDCSF